MESAPTPVPRRGGFHIRPLHYSPIYTKSGAVPTRHRFSTDLYTLL